MNRRVSDMLLNFILISVCAISLVMIYSQTMNHKMKNEMYEANRLSEVEEYIKVQVERTIEMIDIYRNQVPDTIDKELDLLKTLVEKYNQVESADNVSDIWLERMDHRIEGYDNLKYVIYNSENDQLLATNAEITLNELSELNIADEKYIDCGDKIVLYVFMEQDDVDTRVKECMIPLIRDIRLEDNNYIWINEVVNYDGGDDYAIRRVHANLVDTEGSYLSTNTEDVAGDKPYQIELDGIKANGEITFEYHFKKMDSEEINLKMSYAKLYEPYDWIVATGVHVDDVYADISREREAEEVSYHNQLLIYISMFILGLIMIIVRSRMQIEKQRYLDENKNLIDELDQELILKEELAKTAEKAELANEAKTQFLSFMSHEMRTPLNGIIGFIQMLSTTKLNSEQHEIVTIVEISSRTLLALINDLLDVEKYKAGKMMFEYENFDLIREVHTVTAGFRPLVIGKELSYHVDVNLKECYVKGDLIKIRQLLNNLLNNALKFTEKGYIKVIVEVLEADSNIHVKVSVKDSGIGIREEVKPMLFKPFTQADSSISSKYGGTGLGLTICKEITEHYNGTIDYESEAGTGTTFMVDLYFTKGEKTQDRVIKEFNETNETLEARKVLLVEDNVVNQKLMSKFFEKYDIEYELAINGEEAIARCKKYDYKLVFMDCQMPVMDGLTATKKLRDLGFDDMHIIAMTAYASDKDRQNCFEAGMNEFITKPVDFDLLLKRMNIEANVEEIVEEETSNVVSEAAISLMEKIDFEYDICLDLIDTFITQTKSAFVEIEGFEKQKDYESIAKKLHQLKGASGAVRIEEIRAQFEKCEKAYKNGNYKEGRNILLALEEHELLQ